MVSRVDFESLAGSRAGARSRAFGRGELSRKLSRRTHICDLALQSAPRVVPPRQPPGGSCGESRLPPRTASRSDSDRCPARRDRCPGAAGDQIGNQAARSGSHGPAERAMAGADEQAMHRGRTDDGRAVGRHRPQAGPELAACHLAGAGKQILGHHLQRLASLHHATTDRSRRARPCRRRGCACRSASPPPCTSRRGRSRPARRIRRASGSVSE